MGRIAPRSTALLAVVLAAAACGGASEATPEPLGTSSTTEAATRSTVATTSTSTGVAGTSSTTAAPQTTTTSTTAAPEDAFDALVNADFGVEATSDTAVGSPDTAAAQGVVEELKNAGVKLKGIDVWVIGVVGKAKPIVVLDITDKATALENNDASDALLETLASSKTLEDVEASRLVIHYRDDDLILTATLLMKHLRKSIDNGTDISEHADIQLIRTSES